MLFYYYQVKTKHEVSGRKFGLRSLREDHLARMKKLKLIRDLDVDKMSYAEVVSFLQQHGNDNILCFICTSIWLLTFIPSQLVHKLSCSSKLHKWHAQLLELAQKMCAFAHQTKIHYTIRAYNGFPLFLSPYLLTLYKINEILFLSVELSTQWSRWENSRVPICNYGTLLVIFLIWNAIFWLCIVYYIFRIWRWTRCDWKRKAKTKGVASNS